MYIKEDKIEEVINLLKENGFKEDNQFLVYEDKEDYFALNLKDYSISYTGNSGLTIEDYINKFNLKEYLEKAKIDAEKKKVEAQGEAEANALLQQSLTDQIIAQQFIEKWNGQLPTTMTDSAIPFINAN